MTCCRFRGGLLVIYDATNVNGILNEVFLILEQKPEAIFEEIVRINYLIDS